MDQIPKGQMHHAMEFYFIMNVIKDMEVFKQGSDLICVSEKFSGSVQEVGWKEWKPVSEVIAKSGRKTLSCYNKAWTQGWVERKARQYGNSLKSMLLQLYLTCGLKEQIELPTKFFLVFGSNPSAIALGLHGPRVRLFTLSLFIENTLNFLIFSLC